MTCFNQIRWTGRILLIIGILNVSAAGCASAVTESPVPTETGAIQTLPYPVPVETQPSTAYPLPSGPQLTNTPIAYPASTEAAMTEPPAIQTPAFEVTPLTPEPMHQPTQPVPQDPYIAGLVQTARTDLASRLNVSAEDIGFLSYEEVVWPDASLGCPKLGVLYIQVQTDGYKILLGYGGSEYAYHGGGSRSPFLCENK